MIVRAAACGHLDRREEGREWVGRIGQIAPTLTISEIKNFLSVFFVPEALAYQVDGLAKAGMQRACACFRPVTTTARFVSTPSLDSGPVSRYRSFRESR
jgi:hypothetical protein